MGRRLLDGMRRSSFDRIPHCRLFNVEIRMKLEIYEPKFDYNIEAIQFFRAKVRTKALAEIVEKVWAEEFGDCFIRKEVHKTSGKKYAVEYVIKDCNQYLKDGDWIVISSDGYCRVESDEYFKIAFKRAK